MGFSLKDLDPGKLIKKGTKSVKHLFKDPLHWAENAFYEGMALPFGGLDLYGGKEGWKRNVLRNPYVHMGLGAVAAFVPGMQWYVPIAASTGLSALGGGNLEDQLSAATMGATGYGLGSLAQPYVQSAWSALQTTSAPTQVTVTSLTPRTIGTPIETTNAAGVPVTLTPAPEPAGSVVVSMPTPSGGYEPVIAPITGTGAGLDAALGAPEGLAAVSTPAARNVMRFGPTTTALASTQGLGQVATSTPRSTGNVGAILALKGGLGFLQNYEAQKAIEEELKRREETLRWIAMAEQNPSIIYQEDPGLLALRKQYLDDYAARYRAKYGGTEGGAFAKGLMREAAKIDATLLDQAIRRKYGMLSATQPAVQYNMQAGATPLGALAQTGQQVLSDWAFFEFLRSISGGQ